MMRPACSLLCAAGLAAMLAGCARKATEEACDKAIANIRKLTGQAHSEVGADRRAAVRSCRAQSSRDTVECYVEAQTTEELFGCGGELAEAVRAAEKKQGTGAAGSGAAGGAKGSGAGAGAGTGSGAGSGAGAGAGTGAGAGAGAASGEGTGAAPADKSGGSAASGEGSGSGW